jgi:hypothetical protein
MELNDQNLEAARLSAKRVELLLQDKKNLKVLSLRWDGEEEDSNNEDLSDDEYLDMTEDEIGQLNAIRAQQGKRPIKRPLFKRNFKGIMCYYCGLKGHYQKVCRKRIREKGAIIHKPNQTNNIGEQKGPDQEQEEEVPASMAISEFYNCNAISLN